MNSGRDLCARFLPKSMEIPLLLMENFPENLNGIRFDGFPIGGNLIIFFSTWHEDEVASQNAYC